MAIVVKWRNELYLQDLVVEDGCARAVWSDDRHKAHRFHNKDGAKNRVLNHFGRWPWVSGAVGFYRLIPRRRHASPQP